MAGEEPLVAAEGLDADDPRLAALDDLVDQQERVAVRNGGEDFLAGYPLSFIRNASTSLATITP